MRIEKTYRPLRVLDFDIENRPWSYWYDGNTTSMPIAIAWSWVGETEVFHEGIKWSDFRSKEEFEGALQWMLESFLYRYKEADAVTGHYIKKHDLPIINGACFRLGLPPMPPKVAIDTKVDLVRMGGISLSQENIAFMRRLEERKHRMNIPDWEDAYLLSDEGFEEVKERVTSDVRQHKALREELKPYLKPAKEWRP